MADSILRPKNLKPPVFKDNNWLFRGNFSDRFYKGPLAWKAFLKSIFYHALKEHKADEQDAWDFLLRPPHIEGETPTADRDWNPVRILGSGAFGRVGLWRKEVDSQVVDEVALKVASRPDDNNREEAENSDGSPCDGLPVEAAINSELNAKPNSDHIGFLRNFRYYPQTGKNGTYRFYFNYCPYDTLDSLGSRYKMWDSWFPEAFIWHCAVQMMQGIRTLEENPQKGTLAPMPGISSGFFTIHLDLKPGNILLDYATEKRDPDEAEEEEALDFPDLRIADFGLSMYTSKSDHRNPYGMDGGTEGYKPPEQTQHHTRWGANFAKAPSYVGQKWGKSHNIWCAGKILFDIMTHEDWKTLDGMKNMTEEQAYMEKREHFLRSSWGDVEMWTSYVEGLSEDMAKIADERERAEEEGSSDEEAGNGRMIEGEAFAEVKDRRKKEAEERKVKKKEEEERRKARESELSLLQKQYRAMAKHWHYSHELKTLVWEMLRPNPRQRPKFQVILDRARDGKRNYLENLKYWDELHPTADPASRSGLEEATKLYYRETEINEMPQGGGDYEPKEGTYNSLLARCDADWPMLSPPKPKWEKYIKPLGPMHPVIDIYDGSRRIANPVLKMTPQGEAPDRVDEQAARELPTSEQYRALRQSQLAANSLSGPKLTMLAKRQSNSGMPTIQSNSSGDSCDSTQRAFAEIIHLTLQRLHRPRISHDLTSELVKMQKTM